MAHKKGTSVVLVALLGYGFLINPVTSKVANQDINLSISESLVENAIEPTLLSKRFREEQLKTSKENKLVEIEFEEKRINHEDSNFQLDN